MLDLFVIEIPVVLKLHYACNLYCEKILNE
jgi:hypothetical protein